METKATSAWREDVACAAAREGSIGTKVGLPVDVSGMVEEGIGLKGYVRKDRGAGLQSLIFEVGVVLI